MISSVYSAIVQGIATQSIVIESHMSSGIPQIHILGLADQTIREAKDRILVALQYADIKLPNKKFILSLNPTDIKKQGGHLDLAMAISLLKASGHFPNSELKIGALGALNLSGEISETQQVFALIENLATEGCDVIFIPMSCFKSRRFFKTKLLVPVNNLSDVVKLMKASDTVLIEKCQQFLNELEHKNTLDEGNPIEEINGSMKSNFLDFDQVKGQEMAKRAIMLALAGKHHLLMYGPPGTGKTMLASRIPSVLEPLNEDFVYERLKLLSCAGQIIDNTNTNIEEPFRSPHSGISLAAMLGGMQAHMLGEAVMAHRGVLFLDEMPEFKRDVLEGLRGPLESGVIHLSKTHYKAAVPASFVLIATANPCPCGYNGFSDRCNCNERDIQRYFSKLSGPILDRFDLKIQVAFNEAAEHKLNEESPSKMSNRQVLDSAAMHEHIKRVRDLQMRRYQEAHIYNGSLNPSEVEQWCRLTSSGQQWVTENLGMKSGDDSLRHHYKVVKLARTIADFDESEEIDRKHLIESFYYNRRRLV